MKLALEVRIHSNLKGKFYTHCEGVTMCNRGLTDMIEEIVRANPGKDIRFIYEVRQDRSKVSD